MEQTWSSFLRPMRSNWRIGLKPTASTRFCDPRSKFAEGAGAPDESSPHPSLTINNSCGRDESRGEGERAQQREKLSILAGWQENTAWGKSLAKVKKKEAAKLPANQPTLKSSRVGGQWRVWRWQPIWWAQQKAKQISFRWLFINLFQLSTLSKLNVHIFLTD